MAVTIVDNQEDTLKKKIKSFFKKSKAFQNEKGLCPTQDVLASVLDKWSLFIIYNLGYYEVLRFNELKTYIPRISSRMLSVTLKRLEDNKMLTRKIYAVVPPKVEYRLTDFGREMAVRVIDLSDFVVEEY